MNWQIVHLGDVAASPWRNGGGLTRELVAWPDSWDWIWRMSVAEVDRGGPFSRFAGVQRWFAVLGGAGVRLNIGAQMDELTCNSAPLCFDGAAPVDCELLGGPTQDFNLMLRADRARARMSRISGSKRFVLDQPKMLAIYAANSAATLTLDGACLTVPAKSLAWQALGSGALVQIQSSDALWMEIVV